MLSLYVSLNLTQTTIPHTEKQMNQLREYQKIGSIPIQSPQLRIAVLFYGLVHRSLEHTIESINHCLIGSLEGKGNVDIFYHTWNCTTANNPRAGEHHCELNLTCIDQLLPHAHGSVDHEEEFISLIDWEHIYQNNPYRNQTSDHSGEQKTIRNVILSLHSLEMAYDTMLEHGQNYDLVVASRADIRFRKPLVLPENLGKWALCIPNFHGWGGVNDRFAFGGLEAMEVYCRRSAFFDGSMLHPNRKNPEWVLAQWLKRNNIPVVFVDFPFQRIRANGSVFELDQGI